MNTLWKNLTASLTRVNSPLSSVAPSPNQSFPNTIEGVHGASKSLDKRNTPDVDLEVLVDQSYLDHCQHTGIGWYPTIHHAIEQANSAFSAMGVRFCIADTGVLHLDDVPDAFYLHHQLRLDNKPRYDAILAVSGKGGTGHYGMASLGGNHALILNPPTLAHTIQHELAHLFGALDIKTTNEPYYSSDSAMSWGREGTGFDPPNQGRIRSNSTRSFTYEEHMETAAIKGYLASLSEKNHQHIKIAYLASKAGRHLLLGEQHAKDAIANSPQDPISHLLLGHILAKAAVTASAMGSIAEGPKIREEAMQAFTQGFNLLNQDPKRPWSIFEARVAADAVKTMTSTWNIYETARHHTKDLVAKALETLNTTDIHSLLGNIYLDRGDPTSAESHLITGASRNEKDRLIDLCKLYLSTKNLRSYIEASQRLTRADPYDGSNRKMIVESLIGPLRRTLGVAESTYALIEAQEAARLHPCDACETLVKKAHVVAESRKKPRSLLYHLKEEKLIESF